MTISFEGFHKKLVVSLFDRSISDTDAFLLFHILHDFELHVRPGMLVHLASGVVPAITQRHAALCVETLWRGSDDERSKWRVLVLALE